MRTIWLWLLRQLQKRCEHPSYAVKADVHEGSHFPQTQWCEICGSFRFVDMRRDGDWREPRPDWHTPRERAEYASALKEAK